ncbi:MAG: cytochrome c [Betaproteobacteria bacterium]|nr:cytochrome c [Betaproteobacteria bacterium]
MLLAVLIAAAHVAAAQASPFDGADPKTGKGLHDGPCVACHVRLVGGDGSKIYTRQPRLINSPQALLQRVSFCSTQAGAGWFPEDERHVAAYLNQQYYKFK